MAKSNTRRRPRAIGEMFAKILLGTLVLALVVAGAAWISTQFVVSQEGSQRQRDDQNVETSSFDYTIAAEASHIRVDGTANLPNGVILVGTLDKVGSGPIEVKEALVMNRRFAVEFGPELYVQYYLQDLQDALQAGVYRLTVEFDPSQQSPFARESLWRSPLAKTAPIQGSDTREVDPATIRVSKTFAIGSAGEQQEAQTREQEYRRVVRQHLSDTLGTLIGLWERLQAHYQQERLKGGFSRADVRASDWHTWSVQWLDDVKEAGEKAQLAETVSPASPYYTSRAALLIMQKQLAIMPDLYFEVLINERALTDLELQHTEQVAQYALGDAMALLGHPDSLPPTVKVESVKPTLIVTSQLVNVRSGPGMNHESIRQVQKDDVLDFIGEQGEWFQVRVGGGRTGWVHRNVVSKRYPGDIMPGDVKRVDAKPFSVGKGAHLQVESIQLLSTPVEFIPRPTPDEVNIYADVEQQLRGLQAGNSDERKEGEQRLLQRMSDKYGLSPGLIWNTYLKVQGWEIRP